MKKLIGIFLAAAVTACFAACGNKTDNIVFAAEQETAEASEQIVQQESNFHESSEQIANTNILVVYFSRTGNTKALAQFAVESLGADSFEIEAAVPYSDADIAYYTDCRADQEQADPSVRPEIANRIEGIEHYDTILLGYPIWHGQAPRIISTFLESYDFSGKTILPFCTSASSGIGSSDKDLHCLCNADWKAGKRFPADADYLVFAEWLSDNIPANTIGDEDSTMAKELTLMIDGTVIPVIWEENPSVAELLEWASGEPIHIAMSMYGGWEQVGSLGRSIPENDAQITADTGDIMLYSGSQIVLFYGENSWAYTKLGHIALSDEEVINLLSRGSVGATLTAP